MLFISSCVRSLHSAVQEEVFSILSTLDTSKAAGHDKIGPNLLRHCALALSGILHHLYSLCLLQCYIPTDWRLHLIIPNLKSGDTSQVKNYRPISLLCVVSKVLERLVYNHLLDFVESSLTPTQYGFRRKHSTLQQMLVFLNNVYSATSSNLQTDTIYLDFKKAFDRVPHNELLFKLWSIGITGNTWRWLQAYLNQRAQCVSVHKVVYLVLY